MRELLVKIGTLTLFSLAIIFLFFTKFFGMIGETFPNAISYAASLIAVYYGIAAVRFFGFRTEPGKIAFHFTIGIFFWMLGDILWAIAGELYSAADAAYLLGYLFFFAAVIVGLKSANPRLLHNNRKLVLFFIILMIIFYAYGQMRPITINEDIGVAENIVGTAYLLMDLLLIICVVAIFVFLMSGVYSIGWFMFGVGIFLTFIGDFIYYTMFEEGYLSAMNPLNLTWIISYIFFALGFIIARHNAQKSIERLVPKKDVPAGRSDKKRKKKS